ncbi:MAG TPA: hypothetical protein VFP36_03535 [Usitatibacter sp.]|nr:hypothetical protein [Usitatibacter sp.]
MRGGIAIAALLIAACASTPPGGGQGEEPLTVRAWEAPEYPGARGGPEVAGVRCTLSNDKGSWTAITPATVTVQTSTASLDVECRAEGYKPMRASLRCRSLHEAQGKRAAAVLLLPLAALVPLTALPSIAVGLSRQATPVDQEPAQRSASRYPCSYGDIASPMSRQ